MSANDKFGLGYEDYRYGSILSYENEVLQSVFTNKESDLEDTSINDRYVAGMHAVPLFMTGNYMPSKPSEYVSYESDSSIKTTTSMPNLAKNAPKVVCEPKLWTDAPIIEEYKSDSDYDSMSSLQEDKEKPSFAFTDSVQHVETSRENGGSVAFGGSNGRITGKGKIKAGKLDIEEESNTRPLVWPRQAVNTACYVLNRVLVTKPQNMTPYELLTGKQPIISYLRPFGCHVTISDLGFLVGYSLNSKAFRVYNLETKRVEENLHVNFLENKPNVARKVHAWMFDLDYLTNSMNYEPVLVENQANQSAGPKEANNTACIQANDDHSATSKEIDLHEEHFVLPIWSAYSTTVKSSGDKIEKNTDFKTCEKPNAHTNSTNLLNIVSTPLSAASPSSAFNDCELSYPDDPSMPHLEDIYASPSEGIFIESSYDDEGVITDFNNLETTVTISPTPTTRIHTIHPKTQILRDPMLVVQTRSKVNKNSEAHALIYLLERKQLGLNGSTGTRMMKRDPKLPNKVYNVVKALYGLHQAPRACSTKKSWCDEFEELMKNRFQISSMGELTFFLGLQVNQKEDGIFISQDKYVAKILKKSNFLSVKTASTPIETQNPLVKDEEIDDVDVHLYRFQVTPKTSHLQAVKRIFRYLKGQPKLGLWYPKVSSFDLEAYLDIDYAGADLDRKSTIGAQPSMSIVSSSFGLTKKKVNDVVKLRALVDGERVAVTKDVIRKALHLDDADGVECLLNEEIFTELALRKGLLGTSLVVQWHRLPYALLQGFYRVETPLFAFMLVQPQPKAAEEEDDVETCATLSQKVAQLEQDKIAQALEILKLKKSVKKLEKKRRSKSSGLKKLRKVGTSQRVESSTETIVGAQLDRRIDDVSVAAANEVNAVEPTMLDDEEVTMTMAQTLIKMKAKKERLFDEQMTKRLHDDEVEQAAAKEKQQKDDLEKAKVLQKKKYQSLKRKPISIAQARKNMMIYLKNMARYKMEHFRGMTYYKDREISQVYDNATDANIIKCDYVFPSS
nr:hypothetical protein [Tanacetum cinerariifolium]